MSQGTLYNSILQCIFKNIWAIYIVHDTHFWEARGNVYCSYYSFYNFVVYIYIYIYIACLYMCQKFEFSYFSQHYSKFFMIKSYEKLKKVYFLIFFIGNIFFKPVFTYIIIYLTLLSLIDWSCPLQSPYKHLYCFNSLAALANLAFSSQLFLYTGN